VWVRGDTRPTALAHGTATPGGQPWANRGQEPALFTDAPFFRLVKFIAREDYDESKQEPPQTRTHVTLV
jgi:hypothetical protein